jgi:hypothetical protein
MHAYKAESLASLGWYCYRARLACSNDVNTHSQQQQQTIACSARLGWLHVYIIITLRCNTAGWVGGWKKRDLSLSLLAQPGDLRSAATRNAIG